MYQALPKWGLYILSLKNYTITADVVQPIFSSGICLLPANIRLGPSEAILLAGCGSFCLSGVDKKLRK